MTAAELTELLEAHDMDLEEAIGESEMQRDEHPCPACFGTGGNGTACGICDGVGVVAVRMACIV